MHERVQVLAKAFVQRQEERERKRFEDEEARAREEEEQEAAAARSTPVAATQGEPYEDRYSIVVAHGAFLCVVVAIQSACACQ